MSEGTEAPGSEAGPSAVDLPPAAGITTTLSDDAVTQAFSGDLGSVTLMDSARAYIAKVRGGDPGALPALFGLIVLLIVFSQLHQAVPDGRKPGEPHRPGRPDDLHRHGSDLRPAAG